MNAEHFWNGTKGNRKTIKEIETVCIIRKHWNHNNYNLIKKQKEEKVNKKKIFLVCLTAQKLRVLSYCLNKTYKIQYFYVLVSLVCYVVLYFIFPMLRTSIPLLQWFYDEL
jgi:stalled ribosome rescue protein Dom34